jgi:putative inorganic carbon (HCO3(-)) transporter
LNRRQTLQSLLAWTADWQILLVGLLVPLYVLFASRLPVRVLALALLAIPVLWLLHWLARGRPFTPTPLDLPLLLWLITLPVGLWASALPEDSLPILLREVVAVALFYAMVASLNSAGKLKLAAVALIVGTALLAGLGMLGMQRMAKLPFLSGSLVSSLVDLIPHRILSFWNPESSGFHANITGGLLALFVPVTVAYAWAMSWPRRPHRLPLALLLWLLAAAEALVLVLSQSRGAMLGFAAALAVVAIGRNRRWAWLLPLVALVVVVAVVMAGAQPSLDLLLGGAADSAVSSAEGRLELFSRGLYMLQDFSFTGVGLGMFSRVLPLLYPLFLVGPDTEVAHVHNMYLQAGIDHGLPGLVVFLAILLLLAVMGSQAIRFSRKQAWEPLAIGLLAGLAAYSVHGFVDVIASSPRAHILIWAQWGLMVAVWRWAQAHQAERSE